MQKIPLKMAKSGMIIAKAVVNDRGMTLCGADTELSEETIARLERMGVEKIAVKGHPVDMGEGEKSLSEQVEELHCRFKRVEADPLMKKVKDVILRKLQEGAGCE